jgi:hypothetical protein
MHTVKISVNVGRKQKNKYFEGQIKTMNIGGKRENKGLAEHINIELAFHPNKERTAKLIPHINHGTGIKRRKGNLSC